MRIALIVSDAHSMGDFALELGRLGHDVTVVKVGQSPSLKDQHALSLLFMDAGTFDVIHNLSGFSALLYGGFILTPLVTTLFSSPSENELDICSHLKSNCFFVDACGLVGSCLNLIAAHHPREQNLAGFYEAVYEKAVSACARDEQRPWGFFQVLSDDRRDHKVKRITLWPGKRLSLQYHTRRQEHWVVITGTARVQVNDDIIELRGSQSVDVPQGALHRIENIGTEPLVVIEVQQGEYFGEDDIVRIEDDFGRG
ncbi:MAG: cupin domain-containing protein [Desulfomonilia bacterium]